MRQKRFWILALALALLLAVWPADSGAEPSVSGAAMSDAELERRLAFIEERLNAGRTSARYWQNGWSGFFAASAAFQGPGARRRSFYRHSPRRSRA